MGKILDDFSQNCDFLRDWALTKTIEGQRFIWTISAPTWGDIPVQLTTRQTESGREVAREVFRQTSIRLPALFAVFWAEKFKSLRSQIEAQNSTNQ